MGIDTSGNGVLKFALPERLYRGSAWRPTADEFPIAESRMGLVAGMRLSGSLFAAWVLLFLWALITSGLPFAQVMLTTGIVWFVFLLVLAKRVTTWKTSKFYVTNKRVWCISGFLSLKEVSIPLSSVAEISYSSSFLGRRFNYGTLKVEETNGRKTRIRGISDISWFADTVSEYSVGSV